MLVQVIEDALDHVLEIRELGGGRVAIERNRRPIDRHRSILARPKYQITAGDPARLLLQ